MPSPANNGTVNDYETKAALMEALSKCQTCPELDWKVANLQEETSEKESLATELERLQVLRSYRILDTDRRPSFERLTALAARIFDVKICLVSLVDLGRQWFASNRGLGEVRETPRKAAFCAHAILSKLDLFIVNDTFEDSRFKNNPLVIGDPKIRFYAGSPLVTPEGYKLGTFCIIDTKPRPNGLSLEDKQNLREIAALVMEQLNEQKLEYERSKNDHSREIACTSHDLITPLTSIQLNMGLIMEDQELKSLMTRSQRETMKHTKECVDIMSNICLQSIKKFRGVPLGETDLENHQSGSLNIKNLIESIQHVMTSYPKRAALNFRVDDDVPQVIQGDVLAVFRSSLNFLTNACKVSESGVVDFHISMTEESITTQVTEEEDPNMTSHRKYMLVECTDSGPGIQNDQVKELFTAEGGLRLSQGSDIGGLGLGLYSVSELISGCGGSYGYRPCVGKNGKVFGSVFWFKVPAIEKLTENAVNTLLQGISCTRDIEMNADADQASQQPSTSTMNTYTELVNSIEKVNIEEMNNVRVSSTVTPTTESNDDLEDDGKAMKDVDMEKPEKPLEQLQVQKPMEEVITKLKKSSSHEVPKRKMSETDPDTISEYSDSKRMKRKKCALVIDDSKVIRKVLHKALTNMGFDVKLAENGLQGLNEMKSTVFDIVLCDFLMPIMDGMDCVKQYREWEKSNREWFDQYIVGISAHADESDGNRGLDVGMNKFIPKPLPMKVLKGLIDSDEIHEISDKLDELEKSSQHFTYLVNPLSEIEVGSHSTASSVSGDEAPRDPTCLLVEDTKSIAKAMMRCIERNGWKCVTVGDGEQALNLMKMRNWDCVFMDDELPIMHGTTCITHFREWEKKNRVARQNNVYICSAGVDDNSSPPCGFDGVFSKPFKPSNLNEILKKCMAGGTQASLL